MALLPNHPAPISQYWIDRGLAFLSLGNGVFWTKERGWSGAVTVVGPTKKQGGKFGASLGFGTVHGSGTTDRLDGPSFTTSIGFRSLLAFCYPVGFGGNGSGRIFQGLGTTGVTAQEESMFVSNAAGREMTYTHIGTSTVGQWYFAGAGTGIELNTWNCFSLTHDCININSLPVGYKNGVPATVVQASAQTGAYTRLTAVMSLGNRSTDGARGFDGILGPLMLFDHPELGLTAKEHALLARDPNLLFQPALSTALYAPTVAGGPVEGDLNATETGSDTAVISGTAPIEGFLAATESGSDTFVAVGTSFVIDDNYERSSVDIANSSISGVGDSAVISLKPRQVENETAGTRWMEPSARLTGANGFRPTFRFLDYDSGELHGYPFTTSKRMSFSYDRETWYYFDTTTLSAGSHIEFRHNTAFTQNVVYVTRGRQVSPRQWGQFCENIATTYSAFAGPTPAASTFTPTLTSWPGQALIAGEFSTQTDELARTVSETPFYALRINDTSLAPLSGTKQVAIFSTGIHAGEDLAEISLMRAIEFLCGSDPKAQSVRRKFDIRIYGLINAPGRQGGSWRSGFDQGTGGADDAARHFSDVGGAGLETVTIPRTVMLADLAGATPAFIIDMHGTYINTWSTFKDTGNTAETAFHARLGANSGFTIVDEGDHTAGTIAYWGAVTLGVAGISITIEHGDEVPQSDANYVTFGSAIIQSLADMFADGELIVTETGSDTAAISGEIPIEGVLAVTESGSDTFVAVGEGAANDTSFAGCNYFYRNLMAG